MFLAKWGMSSFLLSLRFSKVVVTKSLSIRLTLQNACYVGNKCQNYKNKQDSYALNNHKLNDLKFDNLTEPDSVADNYFLDYKSLFVTKFTFTIFEVFVLKEKRKDIIKSHTIVV